MFRRSFAVILLAIWVSVSVYAQTPEAKKDAEKAVKAFSWSFDGGGSYLGVQTEEITKENFAKYGLRDVRGVAVEKVMDDSPAQAAGLQNGDVIVRFNGEEVTSVRKLTRLIGEIAPDHQARVTVLRGGGEREITATLAKREGPKFENGAFSMGVPGALGKVEFPPMPEMAPMPPMPRVEGAPGDYFVWSSRSGRRIGVGITPLTKQLSEHFGVADGVIINNVRENSPAAKSGLNAGDIIVEVDGKPVKGEGDALRAITEKKEGDVSLTIVRDRNRQTITVTPEEMKGEFNTLWEGAEGGVVAPDRMKLIRPTTPRVPVTPVPLGWILMPGRVL
jgi:serine protease Do